jgi:hypothetical protein
MVYSSLECTRQKQAHLEAEIRTPPLPSEVPGIFLSLWCFSSLHRHPRHALQPDSPKN